MSAAQVLAAFNPFVDLKDAAGGSLEAQRRLATAACELAATPNYPSPALALIEGLVFARMAAAHGDIGDQRFVLSMLAWAVSLDVVEVDLTALLAEALARVALLADSGEELAADGLNNLVARATIETTTEARSISEKMAQATRGAL